jgi:hypothetical protein
MNLDYINLFTFVHFILWFTIGAIYPSQYAAVLGISILWEATEGYFAAQPLLYSFLRRYWFIPEKYWNEGTGNKITDIMANLTGYYIASRLVNKNPHVSKRLFYAGVVLWVASVMLSTI